MKPAWGIVLLVVATAGGAEAQAAGGCGAPPAWRAADARPGRPDREMSACLRSKAYEARKLDIPVASVANGIAASCEVEVDRLEGALIYDDAAEPDQQRQAKEREVMRQASADVTQSRACAAR